jgi:hypothetical protein
MQLHPPCAYWMSDAGCGVPFVAWQGPQYLWLDDTQHGAEKFREWFPSLEGILEDPCHMLMRISRTIPEECCLKCTLMSSFCWVV